MSRINTRFSIGDKLFTIIPPNKFQGTSWRVDAEKLTIGRVTGIITDSPGIDQSGSIEFDNYKEQHSYEETYMAVETGIGSGRVYPCEWLFKTEQEAIEYCRLQNEVKP